MKKAKNIISAVLVIALAWAVFTFTDIADTLNKSAHADTVEQLTSDDWFPEPVKQSPAVQSQGDTFTPEFGKHSFQTADGVVEEFNILLNYTKDGSYQRSEFGKPWVDTDGNGCDTRNDILARDLTNITVNEKCQVMTGNLEIDPYTGYKIDFVRGEGACDKTGWNGAPVLYNAQPGGCSNAVTIDHVISLEEVWYLAARDWSFEKRVQFANDPANLYATGANSWKNSKTPSEVLNDNNSPMSPSGLCTYLSTYVEVVSKYELPITMSTAEAMNHYYINCS